MARKKGRKKSKAKGRYPKVKTFGLPPTKGKPGRYPLNTRGRAANAKGRAKQQLNRGRLSRAQYSKIVARANRKLGKGSKGGKRK